MPATVPADVAKTLQFGEPPPSRLSSDERGAWDQLAFFPAAVSDFPDQVSAAPRSWIKNAYPKLIHYNLLPKGGHFTAWEQPELRAAFESLL